MSSHYEPVPVDDKDESLQDERQVTVKDRTRKRVLASTFLLTILSVVLFYGVLINSNIFSETSGNRDPTNEEVLRKIKSEWAKTHADDERATTGDQYLIGIGYVSKGLTTVSSMPKKTPLANLELQKGRHHWTSRSAEFPWLCESSSSWYRLAPKTLRSNLHHRQRQQPGRPIRISGFGYPIGRHCCAIWSRQRSC